MGKKKEVEDFDSVVESIEEEGVKEEACEEIDNKKEAPPGYLDLGWSDYVLSLLDESEKFEDRPKVIGLRRICELLLGPVVYSKGHSISQSFEYNLGTGKPEPKAVVNYELRIQMFGQERTFFGMAESNPLNSDDFSLPYPVACTESRAEGRAYKKALKLTCLTADEIPQKDVAAATKSIFGKTGEHDHEGEKISKMQIKVITNNCNSCNIDVHKFINSNPKYKYGSLGEVDKEVASMMLKKLTKFINDKGIIPEEIKKDEN
jgi:hypothetical protein